MRFFTLTLATLIAFAQYVVADGVKAVLSPERGGVAVTVTLSDAGGTYSLAKLVTGQVQLVVGGNGASDWQVVYTFPAVTYPTLTTTGTIPANAATSITNGFYLKITSSLADGGTIINYSNRFSMTGMTGTTNAQISAAAIAVGAVVPTSVINDQAAAAPAAATTGAGVYTIPYNLQTGLTKYAPMQSVPPTKITKKNPTPLYPTSAFVLATTFLPVPSILTTLTEAQTFSVSSVENTAAAQSQPTGDMAKFLARWKD